MLDPIASTEKVRKGTSPTPTPTPNTGDLLTTLCQKAAKEVEADRLIIDAQKDYIANLEKQVGGYKDAVSARDDLIGGYKKMAEDFTALVKKKDEVETNLREQLANRDKEIEVLKKEKCGKGCKILTAIGGVVAGYLIFH